MTRSTLTTGVYIHHETWRNQTLRYMTRLMSDQTAAATPDQIKAAARPQGRKAAATPSDYLNWRDAMLTSMYNDFIDHVKPRTIPFRITVVDQEFCHANSDLLALTIDLDNTRSTYGHAVAIDHAVTINVTFDELNDHTWSSYFNYHTAAVNDMLRRQTTPRRKVAATPDQTTPRRQTRSKYLIWHNAAITAMRQSFIAAEKTAAAQKHNNLIKQWFIHLDGKKFNSSDFRKAQLSKDQTTTVDLYTKWFEQNQQTYRRSRFSSFDVNHVGRLDRWLKNGKPTIGGYRPVKNGHIDHVTGITHGDLKKGRGKNIYLHYNEIIGNTAFLWSNKTVAQEFTTTRQVTVRPRLDGLKTWDSEDKCFVDRRDVASDKPMTFKTLVKTTFLLAQATDKKGKPVELLQQVDQFTCYGLVYNRIYQKQMVKTTPINGASFTGIYSVWTPPKTVTRDAKGRIVKTK